MNSNRLAELLITPESCTSEEVAEINQLTELYPYSNFLHILNARVASLKNSTGRNSLLTKAAISSPDRLTLKEYMTNGNVFGEYKFIKSADKIQEPKIKIPVHDKTVSKDLATERPEEPQVEQSTIPGPSNEIEIAARQTENESPNPETESSKQLEEKSEKANQLAVSSGIEIESIPKAENTGRDIADELMENLAAYKASKAHFDNLILKDAQNLPPVNPTTNLEDHTQVDEKFKEIIKPLQKKKSSKKLAKEEQDVLINKFIETDSESSKSVKSAGKKKSSSEDLSLPSAELNDEMVTETLANILTNQGKFEKAIDIYKKLIWKLPQKKAYFAAKIESLKEKISK